MSEAYRPQFNERRENYSGAEYEFDLLGYPGRDPQHEIKIRKMFEVLKGREQKGMKVGLKEQIYNYFDVVKEFCEKQPNFDPENPKKPFPRDLRLEILDKMDIEDPEESDLKIKYYPTGGTVLDLRFKSDAVLMLEKTDPHQEHANKKLRKLITLDASLRAHEKEHEADFKGHVLIGRIPLPEENEEKYLHAVEEISTTVVDKIQEINWTRV